MLNWIVGSLSRLVFAIIFYAAPVIGFWLASSLAAYLGGPAWMAWTAGALLFPVIPGALEFRAWAYRDPNKKPWFTVLDRLSLRTFALGLAFIVALLCFYPQTAFVALSTRGDWMLDGLKGPRVESTRRVLFIAAGGLEWLYNATKQNPFKSQIDVSEKQRTESAEREVKQDTEKQESAKLESEKQEPSLQEAFATPVVSSKQWPWKNAVLHPAVSDMPASAETSIKSVAQYIAKREKDPVLRIKALHDYVADRIAYDAASYYAHEYPPQDAETVFRTHKGVCAGYANLLAALATAINEKIVVVVGNARDPEETEKLTDSTSHAWNAARISGHWYLIDSCWDAGNISKEAGYKKNYRLAYFMLPPDAMIFDHYPEEKTWQLLSQPLTQGEFLRQPMLCPQFKASDFRLILPKRARTECNGTAVVIVKNPDNYWFMSGLEQDGHGIGESSAATSTQTIQIEKPLPDKGTYRINMFVRQEPDQYGKYKFVGSFDFVNR